MARKPNTRPAGGAAGMQGATGAPAGAPGDADHPPTDWQAGAPGYDGDAGPEASAHQQATDATRSVAEATALAATPVVRVTALRDRWRAKRFWPKGDTDLAAADCGALGQDGFEQLRDDNNFTIVPLGSAD